MSRIGARLAAGRAAVLAVACAMLVGGCAFGFPIGHRDVSGLTRRSMQTPDGRELSYLIGGDPDGVRVIYIHGTPGSAADLAGFVADPVAGTESVAVDRLGFGESDARSVVSFERQAAAIAGLLEEQDGARTIVVGHSLGGPIAARLAADFPERVGGLVIVAGSLDPDLEKPRWFNYAAALPFVFPLLARPLQHSNVELMASPEQTRELAKVLSRVRAPTVVIHGEEDSLVEVENADYMRRRFSHLAHIEVIRIEGAGHLLPWTRAGVIRDAVAGLVERERREAERARAKSPGGV
ncbi:MAG: alpha/beta fold hydrolase [Phycisphaerales bacterium JB037]